MTASVRQRKPPDTREPAQALGRQTAQKTQSLGLLSLQRQRRPKRLLKPQPHAHWGQCWQEQGTYLIAQGNELQLRSTASAPLCVELELPRFSSSAESGARCASGERPDPWQLSRQANDGNGPWRKKSQKGIKRSNSLSASHEATIADKRLVVGVGVAVAEVDDPRVTRVRRIAVTGPVEVA